MREYERYGVRVNRVIEVVTALLFLLMILIGAATIFSRYFFGETPMWRDEAIRYLFVYIVFLGTSSVVAHREEINIELWKNGSRASRLVEIACDVFGGLFLAVGGWSALRLTIEVGNAISEGLRIPIGYAYIVIPFSFGLSLLWVVFRLVRNLRELLRKESDE